MAGTTDPLSLLADDDSSSSDSETEEPRTGKLLTDKSYYTPTTTDNTADKLPSPSTLFATVSQPKFLTNHIDPHEVNWDKLIKTAESTTPTDHTFSGKYTAIPPPEDLDTSNTLTTGEISAAPVRYTHQLDETSQDDKTAGTKRSALEEEGESDGEGEGSPSVKKQKVETFREKEKRKRDLGMTSRGKNFVEEEKRILREQFSSN